jgi:CxxC motif-containing protein (DUF1111 family)
MLGKRIIFTLAVAAWLSICISLLAKKNKAKDPGVRQGANGGGALSDLTPVQLALFNEGKRRFAANERVTDGLGPRMNLSSCIGCHAFPAAGGSSPKVNPQFQFATGPDHGSNTVPYFITANGPIREARFKKVSTGAADGGVHDLFTIAGMSGVPSTCSIKPPDFNANRNNVIFRIPTPVFGAGMMEQIRDSEILANQAKEAAAKSRLQIKGRSNLVISGNTRTQQAGETNASGNDGTIARFGWKAQNKSLLIFAGEAYNVEMGISNELFQTEREEACSLKSTPNDTTNAPVSGNPLSVLSDVEAFASFMRFLAPPVPSYAVPGATPASIANGGVIFSQVGCAFCHTPTLMTDPNSTVAALRNKAANLYSDLLLHEMGEGLADGISQGQAEANEFRTAPLWGLGQRIFFLHDGRTNDLLEAILEHRGTKSEANEVIRQYMRLSEKEKQDLLNFLRSL